MLGRTKLKFHAIHGACIMKHHSGDLYTVTISSELLPVDIGVHTRLHGVELQEGYGRWPNVNVWQEQKAQFRQHQHSLHASAVAVRGHIVPGNSRH